MGVGQSCSSSTTMRPGRASGAKMAERVPITTGADPLRAARHALATTGSKRLTNFVQSDAQGVRDDATTIPNNKRRGLLRFKQGMDLGQLSKCVAH